MHKINLSTTAATDTGQARQLNEDVVFARQHAQAALLIVADGMGGHQAGEVASALAVETITQQLDDVLEGEADAAVLQTRLVLQRLVRQDRQRSTSPFFSMRKIGSMLPFLLILNNLQSRSN